MGGSVDLLEILLNRYLRIQLVHYQLGMADDHTEHVVEIVGHTARQPAHGFHLLGLH